MESGLKKREKDNFHVIHKIPYGDGPYVRAKHAQVSLSPSPSLLSLFFRDFSFDFLVGGIKVIIEQGFVTLYMFFFFGFNFFS